MLRVNDDFGSGELLFARKFSDAANDVVDELDRVIKEFSDS